MGLPRSRTVSRRRSVRVRISWRRRISRRSVGVVVRRLIVVPGRVHVIVAADTIVSRVSHTVVILVAKLALFTGRVRRSHWGTGHWITWAWRDAEIIVARLLAFFVNFVIVWTIWFWFLATNAQSLDIAVTELVFGTGIYSFWDDCWLIRIATEGCLFEFLFAGSLGRVHVHHVHVIGCRS